MQDLSYELAEEFTQSFADSVVHNHREAMECFECEKLMKSGIRAFEMCEISERVMREADASGKWNMPADVEGLLQRLWTRFLAPVPKTLGLVSATESKGFVVNDANRFREIAEIAESRVDNGNLINLGRSKLFESLQDGDEW